MNDLFRLFEDEKAIVRFTLSTIDGMLVAEFFGFFQMDPAQPKLQRTWLGKEGARLNLSTLDRVSGSRSKNAKSLSKPLAAIKNNMKIDYHW